MAHFDTLETRDPELRKKQQLASLRGQVAHAKANAPAFAQRLAEVDPEAITSLEALAELPVTRKARDAIMAQ
jgi:phenylacetate-CoA ligase